MFEINVFSPCSLDSYDVVFQAIVFGSEFPHPDVVLYYPDVG